MFVLVFFTTLAISLASLVGMFTLSLKADFLNKILLRLVALSSGSFLGGVFLHLMPAGLLKLSPDKFFIIVLITLIIYLLIEKMLHWHHCHIAGKCSMHTFGYMNLLGDAIHNFIDGLIIATSLLVSLSLGFTAVLAIVLHEIPQEIGDLGVLLYSGFSRKKALFFNFIVAQAVVLGGLVGWILSYYVLDITKFLLPVASGGFIYIALSDLIPEIRKESNLKNFFSSFSFLLLGIGLMVVAKYIF